ncbi:MAG: extracellular solute-binding protein [Spirochaetaceae bacterium]|nr:extracellular solute-binding protein [Spirochaetaceae bacterium]
MKEIRKIIMLSMALFALTAALSAQSQGALIRAENLNLRGKSAYQGDWTHFAYTNPDAPKGGSLTLSTLGTFDNFHRYAIRGNCAAGSEYFYDSLMTASADETDTLYPLIASSVEYAPDYAYFIFTLNPRATDQEGGALGAEDVEHSFKMFYEKGVPQFRSYYSGVTVRALSGNRVRYDMAPELDDEGNNRKDARGNPVYSKEKMLSLATSPVFPQRFWREHDFAEPLTMPPLGTGPYRIKEFKMGQSLTLERVKNYWAAQLPVNKGRYNFDIIRYDYYRDASIDFEAFKAGEYDFRLENSAKNWATGYTGKWLETERIVREEIPNSIAQTTGAFVFNIQRPVFSSRRVRTALNYFFDFQWMNKNLFYGSYQRTRSYFQNTEYEAEGLPSQAERAVLEPLRAHVPPELWTEEYHPPETDGTGNIRPSAREALRIFKEAGWELKNGKLLDAAGAPFSFELLLRQADTDTERVATSFQRNLQRYGIEMRIRSVDDSQFINRLRSRDFDMITWRYPPSQTPSSDLMIVWHTRHIDSTWNTAGVSDPAVDYLTEQIAAHQEDGEKLLALGQAFDRVLTWNSYIIPEWNLPMFRIAHKDKFGKPALRPKYDIGIDCWWQR